MALKDNFVRLLQARIKETAREVFQEFAHDYMARLNSHEDAPAKLPAQFSLIKSREHITVREHRFSANSRELFCFKQVHTALARGQRACALPKNYQRHQGVR